MLRVRLFRRRNVPIPTVAGAAVMLVLGAVALAAVARAMPGFLAVSAPEGHGVLVVEGWISRHALRFAAERFRAGGYDALVVTGGPLDEPECDGDGPTYADRAAAELRRQGVVEPSLVVVPAPASAQDRTYRSAVSVRDWITATGRRVTSLDVLSEGPHARRSRAMYRIALGGGLRIGSIAAPPGWDLTHWWRHSSGTKAVLGEAIGYGWAVCCFWPRSGGSHEELRGVPEGSAR